MRQFGLWSIGKCASPKVCSGRIHPWKLVLVTRIIYISINRLNIYIYISGHSRHSAHINAIQSGVKQCVSVFSYFSLVLKTLFVQKHELSSLVSPTCKWGFFFFFFFFLVLNFFFLSTFVMDINYQRNITSRL